jgi:hypothetical protein
MISEEVLEEIGRQLDIYASAFSSIGEANKEIAALDMQIAKKRDELEAMEKERIRASDTINSLIADYDDDKSKAQVNDLMTRKLGTLVFKGMVE